MSGPLASYIAHHSKAGPVGRAVLVQLVLTCNHDGSPSRYVATWADLEHRTGYSRRAVAKGLREVEGLSTTETAEGLGVGEEAVKTRLHRARAMVRRTLTDRLGGSASLAFQFHATRCDRVVGAVLSEIRQRGLEPR